MSLVFLSYSIIKSKLGYRIGALFFIFLWICLESFMSWKEIAFPWLNLGNVFSTNIKLVQWYEYTGVLGGSLWICAVNIFVFKLFVNIKRRKKIEKGISKIIKSFLYLIVILITPMFISQVIYLNYTQQGDNVDILVYQSNLDPYKKKFKINNIEQTNFLIESISNRTDKNLVDYIIFPETYLHNLINTKNIAKDTSIKRIKEFTKYFPKLNIVLGASLYSLPEEKNEYKYFNSAVHINGVDSVLFYHKSKLVPGVEKIPFDYIIKPILGDILFKLGGASNSYSEDSSRVVFSNSINKFRAGTIICYESVFSTYVTEYVRNGANLLFIITNDGWWSNSQGKNQHLEYSKLRAIENRRSIARSANTGISVFINQKGEIIKSLESNKDGFIRYKIRANNFTTFYSKNPYIIIYLSIIGLIAIIFYYIKRIRNRKRIKK